MPWAKTSDVYALHPLITALLAATGADERTTNEVSGWLTRCAAHSAAVMSDYWFDVTIAASMAPNRWEVLVKQAREAGLITDVVGRGVKRRFRLVELPDELWSIQYRSDVEHNRQRDRDRRDPALTCPVLLRDGDVCRYCGLVVVWADRKSGRGGTFDHREPGKPATVDTYVVACRSCNARRKDDPNADNDVPLRPAPAVPYFAPNSATLQRLAAFYGPEKLATLTQAAAPAATGATHDGGHRDVARSSAARVGAAPARAGATQAAQPSRHRRMTRDLDRGDVDQAPITGSSPDLVTGCPDGSGRDGPGGVGEGQGWSESASVQPAPPRSHPVSPAPGSRPRARRGRRGGRGPRGPGGGS